MNIYTGDILGCISTVGGAEMWLIRVYTHYEGDYWNFLNTLSVSTRLKNNSIYRKETNFCAR